MIRGKGALSLNSIADVWTIVLDRLRSQLSETTINTWFDEVEAVTMEDSAFVLHCSNTFKRSTIETRFMTHIKAALKDFFSASMEVKILDDQQLAAYHGVAPDRPGDLSESEAFTFETYVVGPQNKLAFAAAKAVTEKPGENYNPLFIYGGVGLGKTHLMHAVGNFIREHDPSKRILYIPGETFTNELISAIQQGRNIQFRNRFRSVDVLMVDDIQFIAGKESTQEEFFHTFNTLHTAGKQIILTSDRPPQEIARLEDRLKSRFAWGLTCDIKKPDVETRIAILREKARQENITMDEDVYEAIATRVESNIRELEGSLTRLVAYAQLTNRPITVQLCEEALHDIFAKKVRKEVTAQVIMQAVANYYSITVDDLIRPTRRREIAVPRQIAMYITRDLTNLSLPQIGQVFGNRDHTTVLHGCNQIANAIKNDPSMASVVNDLKEIIVDNK